MKVIIINVKNDNYCLTGDSKLSTLNVCGLVNKLEYNEFVELISSHDIIGITETKSDEADEINVDGYTAYFKHRHKLSEVKSGGICLLVKNSLKDCVTVIKTDCKYVLWLKLSNSLCKTDEDVICGVVYIPPENTRYVNVDCFNGLEQELINVGNMNKYMCLMGDFNARSGILKDYFTTNESNVDGDTSDNCIFDEFFNEKYLVECNCRKTE